MILTVCRLGARGARGRLHLLGMNFRLKNHFVPGQLESGHTAAAERTLISNLTAIHASRIVLHPTPKTNYHMVSRAQFAGGVWELGLACGSWHPKWMAVCRWPNPWFAQFGVGSIGLGGFTATHTAH